MASGNGGQQPIIIIGGGIGGLAAAYSLALKGFPVRVLEQSPEFKEVGAGIQLGPNIFRVLDRIGLKEKVLADVHVPNNLQMRDGLTAKPITTVPLGDKIIGTFGFPYAVTHRADIHNTFLEACRSNSLITLENNRNVQSYDDNGSGVTVTLSNGEKISGRALIACDGLWSKTRDRIVGDGKPIVSGHIAYRGVLKREEVPADLWEPDVILWAGPRTHFVHYPLRRGELYNLVAVFHSDHYQEGWDADGSKELLWKHFEGQRPEVLRMLERINTWKMWVLCDREPVKKWTEGNVALLGDSAHPMLQYLAQGACMATEDAVILADCCERTPNDLQAAFRAYNEQRYLRTARVQIMARIYGQFYHARGPAAELRDQMLANRTQQQAHDAMAWLYGGPALS